SRPNVPAEVVAATAGLLASPPGTGPLLAASSLFPDRPLHPELQYAGVTVFHDEAGSGLLRRGAARYQILVPSYTVMFAFALVLPVGWLFVMERRQGTIKRLRAAPVSRSQVLLGKLLPCLVLSIAQGLFLLAAG